MWSKQTICAYVAREAMAFLKQGIRINAICPGPTDTPLAQANKDMWLGFGSDYRAAVGVEAATPLEQAYPLVFLCSDARRRDHGPDDHHRLRLLRRGRDRGVPRRDPGRQLPPRPLLTKRAARRAEPVEFDPFSDEYFNDPTEVYRRLRDEAPVYFSEQLRVLRAVTLRRRVGGAPRLGDVLERARHRSLDAVEGLRADPELQAASS